MNTLKKDILNIDFGDWTFGSDLDNWNTKIDWNIDFDLDNWNTEIDWND